MDVCGGRSAGIEEPEGVCPGRGRRADGKAEATVNVNGNVNGIEASEMRVEALVRTLRLEGNAYGEDG